MSLGVQQFIVAVNKMDDASVNFEEARFEEIKAQLSVYLDKIGLSRGQVVFVPTSGLAGDYVVRPDDEYGINRMKWNKRNPTLI